VEPPVGGIMARMEYKKSRKNAKRIISSAKEKKQKECANDLNDS